MESKNFIEVTILVRPHQLSNLYQFAGNLANNADMAFNLEGPHLRTVSAGLIPVTKVTQVHATPDGGTVTESEVLSTSKPEADKQPDGPPQSVAGDVDPTKFSGCRNVNEVVGILWKDNGIRTVADARVAFDQIRASGECACAKVVPEDGIDTRITRAIELLKSE